MMQKLKILQQQPCLPVYLIHCTLYFVPLGSKSTSTFATYWTLPKGSTNQIKSNQCLNIFLSSSQWEDCWQQAKLELLKPLTKEEWKEGTNEENCQTGWHKCLQHKNCFTPNRSCIGPVQGPISQNLFSMTNGKKTVTNLLETNRKQGFQ